MRCTLSVEELCRGFCRRSSGYIMLDCLCDILIYALRIPVELEHTNIRTVLGENKHISLRMPQSLGTIFIKGDWEC